MSDEHEFSGRGKIAHFDLFGLACAATVMGRKDRVKGEIGLDFLFRPLWPQVRIVKVVGLRKVLAVKIEDSRELTPR